MTAFRHRQRGEGKIGCIVSLLVFAILVAIGFQAVPVFWSNNELKDAAKDAASRASTMPAEAVEKTVRGKAAELGIGEALKPGAITASKQGDNQQGTCVVRLRYKRVIDFYGVTSYTWETNEEVRAPYISGA